MKTRAGAQMNAKKSTKEVCVCERYNFQFNCLNLVIDSVCLGKQCLKGWEHRLNKWWCNISEQEDNIADIIFKQPFSKVFWKMKKGLFPMLGANNDQ